MRKTTVAAWAQAHQPWLLIPTIGGAIGLVAVLQPALVLYSALALAALGAPALLAWLLVRAPEILFALYMSIGLSRPVCYPCSKGWGSILPWQWRSW